MAEVKIMEEKDIVKMPPTQDGGVVAAAIAGFVAGVASVLGLLKIIGKD